MMRREAVLAWAKAGQQMTRREAALAWARAERVRRPRTVQGETLGAARSVIVHPFRRPCALPPILVRLRYEGEDEANPDFLQRVGAPVPAVSVPGRRGRFLPWVAVYASPERSAVLVLYPEGAEDRARAAEG